MIYELSFPLSGQAPAHDHGYAVYSALCREAPWLHETESKVLIGPIGGLGPRYQGVLPPQRARLRFRLPLEHLNLCLGLTGREIQVVNATMKLGTPEIQPLNALPNLQARIVTIKGFQEEEPFLEAARRQLEQKGILGELKVLGSPANGQPWRRVLRIREKTIVGFSVMVTGLNVPDSLKLQGEGLGGRGKMGCGYFVALR